MILLVFFHLLTIQQLWHLNMAPLLYKYAWPSKANDKFISILHILIFPDPGMHSVWSDAVFRTNMESFSISPRNIPRLVHASWRLPAPVTWVLIVWTSLAFLLSPVQVWSFELLSSVLARSVYERWEDNHAIYLSCWKTWHFISGQMRGGSVASNLNTPVQGLAMTLHSDNWRCQEIFEVIFTIFGEDTYKCLFLVEHLLVILTLKIETLVHKDPHW